MAGEPQKGLDPEPSGQNQPKTSEQTEEGKAESLLKTWGAVILLFGVLYLFLVSINMMGGSFKLFREDAADGQSWVVFRYFAPALDVQDSPEQSPALANSSAAAVGKVRCTRTKDTADSNRELPAGLAFYAIDDMWMICK